MGCSRSLKTFLLTVESTEHHILPHSSPKICVRPNNHVVLFITQEIVQSTLWIFIFLESEMRSDVSIKKKGWAIEDADESNARLGDLLLKFLPPVQSDTTCRNTSKQTSKWARWFEIQQLYSLEHEASYRGPWLKDMIASEHFKRPIGLSLDRNVDVWPNQRQCQSRAMDFGTFLHGKWSMIVLQSREPIKTDTCRMKIKLFVVLVLVSLVIFLLHIIFRTISWIHRYQSSCPFQ
jgi:hypothetical protein